MKQGLLYVTLSLSFITAIDTKGFVSGVAIAVFIFTIPHWVKEVNG